MAFTVNDLVDDRFLVSGTDHAGNSGATVLDSPAWRAYLEWVAKTEATEAFNAAVDEHFAGLVEVLDDIKTQTEKSDWSVMVVTEGEEGTPSEAFKLDDDGVLLRFINAGLDHRLFWVSGELVALAD